jgi:RNA polymerase sigma-70 factor (ECF subfamily)
VSSNINQTDDTNAWEALQRGDAAAFRCLFERYHATLLNDAYRLTADKDMARDIVQEVFLKIWNKKEQLTIQSSGKAYLRRAVVNCSLNFLRTHRRHLFEMSEQMSEPIDESPERMIALMETETQEARVRYAIETLPEKCRLVFVLSRFEKMSHKEIAIEMNISVKTIENQITKAIKMLRDALA